MDPHLEALQQLLEVSSAAENRDKALYHLAMLDRSQRQVEVKLAHFIRENRSLKSLMAETSKDFEPKVLELEAKSAELVAANERMSVAEQVAKFGIWEANHNTQTIVISQGMKTLLRLPEEVPLEMSLADWNCLLHPGNAAEVIDSFAKASDEEDFEAEFHAQLADGTNHWHRVRARGEFAADRLVRRIGATIDITVEKEALEALRVSEAAL